MKLFSVETIYMTHSGGTKFYEMVKLTAKNDQQRVLIKRYGSLDKKKGGGQTKVESFHSRSGGMSNAFNKMVQEKEKGKSDGQYRKATFDWGFHKDSGMDINATALKDKLHKHYVNARDAEAIYNELMGLVGEDGEVIGEAEMIMEPVAPAPEPDRGENWGSW